MSSGAPILDIDAVSRAFGGGRTLTGRSRPALHAVMDVSFTVRRGETLGIVGESGCGKSTLARMLVGLDQPTEGTIRLASDMGSVDGQPARRIQYVFQDPVSSLNPRKTIRAILEAPLIHLVGLRGKARRQRLVELMEAVKLHPDVLERYPHEFSGGQAQRIAIARALAAEPDVIVLDEPVSALDVSIQAQVLNLLDELKQRLDLTYVFISHDLSVVESVSDRIAVMYFGRIVEIGPARSVFSTPRHRYSELLLASAPVPGRPLHVPDSEAGELPDPYDPPQGCAFAPRCPAADATCRGQRPTLEQAVVSEDHRAACFHPPAISGGAMGT